jgi:hypothetical protein
MGFITKKLGTGDPGFKLYTYWMLPYQIYRSITLCILSQPKETSLQYMNTGPIQEKYAKTYRFLYNLEEELNSHYS